MFLLFLEIHCRQALPAEIVIFKGKIPCKGVLSLSVSPVLPVPGPAMPPPYRVTPLPLQCSTNWGHSGAALSLVGGHGVGFGRSRLVAGYLQLWWGRDARTARRWQKPPQMCRQLLTSGSLPRSSRCCLPGHNLPPHRTSERTGCTRQGHLGTSAARWPGICSSSPPSEPLPRAKRHREDLVPSRPAHEVCRSCSPCWQAGGQPGV